MPKAESTSLERVCFDKAFFKGVVVMFCKLKSFLKSLRRPRRLDFSERQALFDSGRQSKSEGFSDDQIAKALVKSLYRGQRIYEFIDEDELGPAWGEECYVYLFQTSISRFRKYGISFDVTQRAYSSKQLYAQKLVTIKCRTRAEAFVLEQAFGARHGAQLVRSDRIEMRGEHPHVAKSTELTELNASEFMDIISGYKDDFCRLGLVGFLADYLPEIHEKYYGSASSLLDGSLLAYVHQPPPEYKSYGGYLASIILVSRSDWENDLSFKKMGRILALRDVPNEYERIYGKKLFP